MESRENGEFKKIFINSFQYLSTDASIYNLHVLVKLEKILFENEIKQILTIHAFAQMF